MVFENQRVGTLSGKTESYYVIGSDNVVYKIPVFGNVDYIISVIEKRIEEKKPKQERYKTAFSPLFNVYVTIDEAFQDSDGRWIYTCSSDYTEEKLDRVLFTENELTNLCL